MGCSEIPCKGPHNIFIAEVSSLFLDNSVHDVVCMILVFFYKNPLFCQSFNFLIFPEIEAVIFLRFS